MLQVLFKPLQLFLSAGSRDPSDSLDRQCMALLEFYSVPLQCLRHVLVPFKVALSLLEQRCPEALSHL